MDYTNFWLAIHGGEDWNEVLTGIKRVYKEDKRKINNLNRQKNRVRAFLEGRSVQRRSGKYTKWIHEVVAERIAHYAGADMDQIYLIIGREPPAGYELRGYFLTMKEVAEYMSVIPPEYLYIVPTPRGWAVYVQS